MLKLKELRKAKNMKQIDVAEKLGVSRSTVSMWETASNHPDHNTLVAIAELFDISVDTLLGNEKKRAIQIPVIGNVRAGIPIEAVEEILDYEEINADTAANGEYFALRVEGDSMNPRINEGDVVIVRCQPDADSGDIVVAMVNGSDATVKKLIKKDRSILLMPLNTVYEPIVYSNEDIISLPVSIIGKVVELRAKF